MSEPLQRSIDGGTRCCAVLGHPVRHTASPAMQNAGLSALGLNWRYLAFDVDPAHLGEAIAGARRMNFIGLNLTVPHKILAVDLVEALDDSARQWGAVNTIVFEGRNDTAGSWRPSREFAEAPAETRARGFNTDADAITRSLAEDLRLELRGTRAMLLGAGGAGRTAALKLASEGAAELHLVNRTASKATAVAEEIHARWPGVKVSVGYPDGTVDLVVNGTSLGLKPEDPLPLDERRFPLNRAAAVYDMIYRPAETPLLARAKAAGCAVANGLGMLLYQGAKALELWTDQAAPLGVMREALSRNIYD